MGDSINKTVKTQITNVIENKNSDKEKSSFYSSMMFITLFMVTICSLKFIYEITWKKIFFVGITAYTAQHISYEIFTLFGAITQYTSIFGMYTSDIIDFSSFNVGTLLIILIYLGIYVMVYLITYLTIGKKTNSENRFGTYRTSSKTKQQ